MPRQAKKCRGSGGAMSTASDVTLYAYANMSATGGRIKKSCQNGIVAQVRELCENPLAVESEVPWDKKEDLDTTISKLYVEENEDTQCDSAQDLVLVKKFTKHKKSSSLTSESDTEVIYPVDLWFLIGSYIQPEDVGRFAMLCQTTNFVVHSAQFWISLYKRCKPKKNEILFLQADNILKVHGLRCRVIRSLFHLYEPFKQRASGTLGAFQQDLSILVSATCTLMWYTIVKNHWRFCFKFHLPHGQSCILCRKKKQRSDRDLSGPLDVWKNPENNYCVLEVIAENFIALQTVMGQVLKKHLCVSVLE